MAFDHFRILFLETTTYLYYINSQGYVERFPKAKMTSHGVAAQHFEKMVPHYYERRDDKRDQYVYIMIKKEHYLIKQLVARHFSRSWEPGSRVSHKDGDPRNCNIENLIVRPRNYRPPQCANSHPIEFLINGRWKRYASIKEAAEQLHISLSALKRHITHKNTRPDLSVMGDTKFRFVEKQRRT